MRTALPAGALTALALTAALHTDPARAGPADYVATPAVEEGEREIDLKLGSARSRDGQRTSVQTLGLGWGVNAWWFTELYAKWHKEPGEPHGFDAWEWENKVQLLPTGQFPLDLGLLLEIERPKDRSEGYELRWGPLLQTEFDRLQLNLNLLLEKHLRAAESGPAELGYQWQAKYRWAPAFELGVQGFGTLGPWDRWSPAGEQSHVAGPAVFGHLRVGERQRIRYNAAVLQGLNHASPRSTLRLQTEYEF